MTNKMDPNIYNELIFKIDLITEYLQSHGGYYYKLFNIHDFYADEPESDIVEYALDIKAIIEDLNKEDSDELPF